MIELRSFVIQLDTPLFLSRLSYKVALLCVYRNQIGQVCREISETWNYLASPEVVIGSYYSISNTCRT